MLGREAVQSTGMVKKLVEKWVPARLTENPVTNCLVEKLLKRWLQLDWQRYCKRVCLERGCLITSLVNDRLEE
jgi:hypothetical protein